MHIKNWTKNKIESQSFQKYRDEKSACLREVSAYGSESVMFVSS